MCRKPLARSIVAAIALSGFALTANATDWLQFGFDQAHSGNNSAEVGYATPTGNVTAFHNAIALTLIAPDNNATDAIDSAPVYLTNVSTASGNKNILFAMSKFGMLVALDAANGSIIWSKSQSGHPTSHSNVMNGSPAIDFARQYVYAYMLDGNVHKFAVGDGTEVTTGGWPQVSTLKPQVEKGASAISIANTPGNVTYLYSVMDGYIGDGGDYQGHITAVNLGTGVQKVFNTECSDLTSHFVINGTTNGAGQNDCKAKQNGIWGRPGAIYDPGTNRLFITTGNGPYDPANTLGNGISWGDSVLALNPDGSGSGAGMPVDNYTPTTFGSSAGGDGLQGTDADLGSVSVALLPTPAGVGSAYHHLGLQPGKDGCVRLINLANMNGNGPGHAGGETDQVNFPGGQNCSTGHDGPEIKPQPAVWVDSSDSSTWAFVTAYNNSTGSIGAAAYKIAVDGSGVPSLSQQWTAPSGTSPVYANGILYYLSGGKVVALNAKTGASIWTSASVSGIHWQSLIVVDSHVFVIDGASQLWSFVLDGVFNGKFE